MRRMRRMRKGNEEPSNMAVSIDQPTSFSTGHEINDRASQITPIATLWTVLTP